MAAGSDAHQACKQPTTGRWLYRSHILQKGLQAGGILGVAVAVPVAVYRAKSISLPLATAAIGRTALGITAVTGGRWHACLLWARSWRALHMHIQQLGLVRL